MGTPWSVRSFIYGPKDRINAFLTDQQLIKQDEAFRMLRDMLTLHSLMPKTSLQASVIPPVDFLLDLSVIDAGWMAVFEEDWLDVLQTAQAHNLQWEYARIGADALAIRYQHSPTHKHLISFSTPEILDCSTREQTYPLNLL